MKRNTKIICTLGPSSTQLGTISSMAQAGMDIARINFSHGTYERHRAQIDLVRQIGEKQKKTIAILGDLQGYRIRIGELKAPRKLLRNQRLFLTKTLSKNKDHIPFDFEGDMRDIKKGLTIFLDDGKMALKVIGHKANSIEVQVAHEGTLQSRKGVNIPGLKLKANILTDKDKADILFAIENKIEYIAQSFVRNRRDILNVIDLVRARQPNCRFIAKIENEDGVRNLESIMDVCDGIMIARGDLGVSLPIYKIALVQKEIARRCNRAKKFVITATQMLDSMTEFNRPTRAEVSDVTNAILDGTDSCMLSAETAAGEFPVESVQMMRQIIEFTENAEMMKLAKLL